MDIKSIEVYNHILSSLQGTCNMKTDGIRDGIYNYHSENNLEQPEEIQLEEWVDKIENDSDFDNFLDNEIFLCETCGWWCEICEQTSEGDCQDCYDSMYGDEEE